MGEGNADIKNSLYALQSSNWPDFPAFPKGVRPENAPKKLAQDIADRGSVILSLIKPTIVVALGATAARSLFGKTMAIGASRGRALMLDDGMPTFVTTHLSALLRVREEDDREAQYKLFLADLRRAAAELRKKAA